jgi:D-tagatose-1,6-bisphosphate aldolase subunit GatZ/KbaZ
VKIRKKTDNSSLREDANKKNIPVIELLMNKLDKLYLRSDLRITLLAVCPNSENVLKAALRSAKRAGCPIKFAATLNQVDIDRGYTGWNQGDLVRKIKEESYRIGYNGPIIIAVDHGGPWVKDIQTTEKWNLDKAMNWTKKSFEAAILAGYDLIHIDPTVDIFNKNITIKTVVERTIELLVHCETFREAKSIKPISYEVGTEEVHGGLADTQTFKKFLDLLKSGLSEYKLKNTWPVFIVAKVGTDLHTSTFDPETAETVVKIASKYNSWIKGHYTDFVSNPQEYPITGIGAANVGPEFTIAEYEALNELSELEQKLYKQDHIAYRSNYKDKLIAAVIESGRWKKWLLDSEKDFDSLSDNRKEWIIQTSCRYIWAEPEVKNSQNILYKNLYQNGIDANTWVLSNIESSIDRYLKEFNLTDLNKKLL